jgi:hypothetical protein
MSKALIVTHGNDLEFLNVVLNIVEEYRKSDISPEILDMSTVVKGQDAFNRRLLKFAGCVSPEITVLEYLRESGITVHDANHYIDQKDLTFPSSEIENSIDESIRSTLISMSGAEHPVQNQKYHRLSNLFKLEAQLTFNAVMNMVLANGPYDQISVVNGRFPYQRAVHQASKYLKIKAMSFERGTYEHLLEPGLSTLDRYLKSTNYWHEDFPTTDRKNRQENILLRFHNGDSGFSRTNPQTWLAERRTPLGRGSQFNENWSKKLISLEDSSKKFISLFTSSLDEFAELGPEWKEAKWKNQWEAFEYLIPLFYDRGYEVILRVHPNLRNKHKTERVTVREVLKEFKKKFTFLKVIDSSSKIDSYNLVENSAAVIVWNSTVGLEASLLGTPTACLSSCEYDLVADVHRWLSKEDVKVNKLLDCAVDKSKAGVFISGVYLFDRPLDHLLPRTRLNLESYGRGLALFSNRWAFRGNNRIPNLISILLPRKVLFAIRKKIRKFKYYKR